MSVSRGLRPGTIPTAGTARTISGSGATAFHGTCWKNLLHVLHRARLKLSKPLISIGTADSNLATDETAVDGNVKRMAARVAVPQGATGTSVATSADEDVVVIAGLYGSLRVTRTGHWTYVPDQEA